MEINWTLRIVLASVIYGLSNFWGNVGKFLPPVIIDPIVIAMVALVFTALAVGLSFKTSIPVLGFTLVSVVQCVYDPGVRAFVGTSFGQEWSHQAEMPKWLLIDLIIAMMVSLLIHLLQVRGAFRDQTIFIYGSVFVLVNLWSFVVGWIETDGRLPLFLILLTGGLYVFRLERTPGRDTKNLLRFPLLIWLMAWLDALQVIAYAFIRE